MWARGWPNSICIRCRHNNFSSSGLRVSDLCPVLLVSCGGGSRRTAPSSCVGPLPCLLPPCHLASTLDPVDVGVALQPAAGVEVFTPLAGAHAVVDVPVVVVAQGVEAEDEEGVALAGLGPGLALA